jgi:hypothetical protein
MATRTQRSSRKNSTTTEPVQTVEVPEDQTPAFVISPDALDKVEEATNGTVTADALASAIQDAPDMEVGDSKESLDEPVNESTADEDTDKGDGGGDDNDDNGGGEAQSPRSQAEATEEHAASDRQPGHLHRGPEGPLGVDHGEVRAHGSGRRQGDRAGHPRGARARGQPEPHAAPSRDRLRRPDRLRGHPRERRRVVPLRLQDERAARPRGPHRPARERQVVTEDHQRGPCARLR